MKRMLIILSIALSLSLSSLSSCCSSTETNEVDTTNSVYRNKRFTILYKASLERYYEVFIGIPGTDSMAVMHVDDTSFIKPVGSTLFYKRIKKSYFKKVHNLSAMFPRKDTVHVHHYHDTVIYRHTHTHTHTVQKCN